MRKLTHEEIVSRQVKRAGSPRLPLCVVLNNIRSLHNVGTIFRTADGAGVEKIWLCGITGYPPQGGIAKTALGAEDHVPWEYREDILGLIKELKNLGVRVSRIGLGIPVGSAVEYVDMSTLAMSLNSRRVVDF